MHGIDYCNVHCTFCTFVGRREPYIKTDIIYVEVHDPIGVDSKMRSKRSEGSDDGVVW